MSLHDDSKPAFERPICRRSVLRVGLGLAAAVRRFLVSPALEGRGTMSVGRQWVRWLALLLAAGMVVEVPALVGVGASGASAARPTPSYSVNLSINPSTCVATVTASWNNAKVNSVLLTVTDLNYTSAPDNAQVSVSGKTGTVSHTFNLNKKPIGTDPFNAQASFTTPQGAQGPNPSSSVDAPCYLGPLP